MKLAVFAILFIAFFVLFRTLLKNEFSVFSDAFCAASWALVVQEFTRYRVLRVFK